MPAQDMVEESDEEDGGVKSMAAVKGAQQRPGRHEAQDSGRGGKKKVAFGGEEVAPAPPPGPAKREGRSAVQRTAKLGASWGACARVCLVRGCELMVTVSGGGVCVWSGSVTRAEGGEGWPGEEAGGEGRHAGQHAGGVGAADAGELRGRRAEVGGLVPEHDELGRRGVVVGRHRGRGRGRGRHADFQGRFHVMWVSYHESWDECCPASLRHAVSARLACARSGWRVGSPLALQAETMAAVHGPSRPGT
eukprot:923620-Rhodomonas_salina.7